VKSGRVTPGGILAVTFTNKAAREMLTRVGGDAARDTRGMWIGTSTACATGCCARHTATPGLPQAFQISIRRTSSRR